MKIHKQPKKVGPTHPEVTALISRILSTPDQSLPSVLSTIQTWNYPRCDLHSWSPVLNRFDELLEQVIKEYDVDKLQVNDFMPSAKDMLSEILRFERLLLDNSTNRKIYASYDRLNALLFTTDLDILILTLRLFLRPAQQYSAQVSLSTSLALSTSRLATLAMRFPTLRDHNFELAALVSTTNPPPASDLPPGDLQFSFYRLDGKGSTPGPVGLNVINLPGLAKDPRPTADIVAAAMSKYLVPEEERFELLHRVRLARSFGASPEHAQEREKLAVVRLLAVAIFCHTHTESIAQGSLFLPDPILVTTVAECISSSVPASVQTAALAALDGLARYRGKLQEVMAAVNAGVSHGILMSSLRRAVGELEKAEEGTDLGGLGLDGMEQLLGFVTYLASNSQGGNMIVGAGLIPLLVQIIENTCPAVLAIIPKTMVLVDNVLYGYTNAFSIWINSRGIDVLVDRIRQEVNENIERSEVIQEGDDAPTSPYGRLPHVRSMALKNFLRSMHRMMQSSGTSEGLRSLIDSSLSKSVKLIMEHRGLFGPHIFGLSINIMATFIHNEPTSLTILQEQRLPETFYNAIGLGIEPAIEVVQAIPNAIGALCLNDAGIQLLSERGEIIPSVFEIFTSDKHTKLLQDRENAAAVGAAFDELIRHHPAQKPVVMAAIKGVFDKIEELAKQFEPQDDMPGIYQLKPVSEGDKGKGKQKEGADPAPELAKLNKQVSFSEQTIASIILPDADASRIKRDFGQNPIITYIEVLVRFLDGLFQHTPHCREFMNTINGVERLGTLYTLPCLPYDFTSSPAAEAIVGVLRIMCEVGPHVTLTNINQQMRESLDVTKDFWSTMDDKAKLESLAELPPSQELVEGNKLFRNLIALLGRLTLISEVYSGISYSHGRGATAFLQTLNGDADDSKYLEDLSALNRACVWENILLKAAWPKAKSSAAANGVATPGEDVAPVTPSLPHAATSQSTNVELSTTTESKEGEEINTRVLQGNDSAKDMNIKAIKHVVSLMPTSLTIFFQAIVKMLLYSRRNVDAAQKKQAAVTASVIADSLVKHLQFKQQAPTYKFASEAYGTVMLSLVSVLFFDERTSQHTMQTMLVLHFWQAGGLQAIFDLCRGWSSAANNLMSAEVPTEDDTRAIVHIFGGLKVTLSILEALASVKPLFESGQTALLTTRDKKPGDKDYFEPHNFLIKLRLDILPFMYELWEAPWLTVPRPAAEGISASPLSVIKSIVRIIQHIMSAEGEERKAETVPNPAGLPFGAGGLFGGLARPSVVPDQERVQQLLDMGFARHSAERALSRTGNHVGAAAEYLLSNPLAHMHNPAPPPAPVLLEPVAPLAVPAPDDVAVAVPAAAAVPVAAAADAAAAPDDAAADVGMDEPADEAVVAGPVAGDISEDSSAVAGDVVSNESENAIGTSDKQREPAVKEELDGRRKQLEQQLPHRALSIVDAHDSLLFDVKGIFISSSLTYGPYAFQTIVDDIKAFAADTGSIQETRLSIRCHLLALVLHQSDAIVSKLLKDSAEPLMSVLLHLFQRDTAAHTGIVPNPKWLAAALLAVEALLISREVVSEVTVPKEGEPIPQVLLFAGPDFTGAEVDLFSLCMLLLSGGELRRDELIATLRLLVILTRNRQCAVDFLGKGGLSKLIERFQRPTFDHAGCQMYLVMILRHIVEDDAVLRDAMKEAVVDWFHQPRSRVVEVPNFLRGVYMLALRDTKVFVDSVTSVCQLDNAHPVGTPHHITLRPITSGKPDSSENMPSISPEHDVKPEDPLKHPSSSDSLDAVMQYLITELFRVGKANSGGLVSDKPQDTVKSPIEAQNGSKEGSDESAVVQVKDIEPADAPEHIYMGELMSWLTELLSSYNGCKVAFVNHTKRRSGKERVGTPAKQRQTVLDFLLQDMLFSGSLNPPSAAESSYRTRADRGLWTLHLLTALCRDVFAPRDGRDLSNDLVTVRKVVLDAICKAIKDISILENSENKYDSLRAIADLCHQLLAVRSGTSSKLTEDTSIHMAKLMLEKNFVSVLTSSLAEVDLNYPNMKILVNAILRPLEHLTKIAIKMGRTSEKDKDSDKALLASPRFSAFDRSASTGREETPDLYRNSALGMFGGEMEEMAYESQEQEDDEDDVQEDEMEVEFEDQDTEGTDLDTEEEEEAAEAEENEAAAAASEDGWEDQDQEMDEEEDEASEDSEDEDGEEEGEEIIWEENPELLGNPEDGSGEEGDDDGHIPVQMMEDDGLPDDDDDVSDVGDFNAELDLLEPEFALGPGEGGAQERLAGNLAAWGIPLEAAHGGGADGRERHMGLFFPPIRRSRGPDNGEVELAMGRSRNPVDHITVSHPLLADPATRRAPSTGNFRHSHRRPTRGLGLQIGNNVHEILQTLEGLDDAVQLLGQLLTRTHGADVEVGLVPPAGAVGAIMHGHDRELLRQLAARRPPSLLNPIATSLAPQRIDRSAHSLLEEDDFGPLPSLARWQEEAAITQGPSAAERAARLANHLILSLLPSARQAAAEAKLEEEKEARIEAEAEAAQAKAAAEETSSAATTPQLPQENELPMSDAADALPESAAQAELGPISAPDEDVEMEDDDQPAVVASNVDVLGPAPTDLPPALAVVEAAASSEEPSGSEQNEAGPSNVNARITVLVNGQPVDITDTGIDPTFLEALPDDMREEVLNQHFRERRPALREEVPQGSSISAEFLEALPADIRAEILAQEGAEQRRIARENAVREAGAAAAGPVDMDPASFFASLDPQLRSVVLLEQEDGFLQTLPSSLIAEANDLRALSTHRRIFPHPGDPTRAIHRMPGGQPEPSALRKPTRDAIQLLDKAGIATLVRLLFFPQLVRKNNHLHKVLVNISENGKTRAELVNLLLNILQDGTGDLATVDKAFAQMSFRQGKPTATPKSTPRQPKNPTEMPAVHFSALPSIPGENVPNFIAQRSIEALTYVVNANEQAAVFFLTEQEAAMGLKRASSKKGKGKEKQGSSTKYPIVVLLGLLDRPTLLSTPVLMDSVAALLATVTRPLATLPAAVKAAVDGSVLPDPAQAIVQGAPTTEPPVPAGAGTSRASGTEMPAAIITLEGAVPDSRGAQAEKAKTGDETHPPSLLASPPQIPHHTLRLIVNILTVGECSSKTFQQTLALISNLSLLPDARDIIAAELKGRAQGLGSSLYADLDQLAIVLEDPTATDETRDANVTKFSPASSDQAKLLRVLKTIDYMFLPKKVQSPAQIAREGEPEVPAQSQPAASGSAAPVPSVKASGEDQDPEKEKVYAIYEGFRFTALWKRLGDCLAIVEDQSELEHVATMLLPLIESLMVVCKYVAPKSAANASSRLLRGSASPRSPTTPRETMEDLFVTFTDAHRKMLNVMVRNNPSLMSGSFSLLVQNPRVLDFDNKRNFFNQQLHKRPHDRSLHQTLQLNIRRARVFEDSFQYLQRKTGDQIKYGKLSIRFYDEEGVDAGGVTREWFQILARQMFNPDYALFEPCAADRLTYQPNRASWINPEHLLFFKFVGRIIGKAIYDGRLLDAHFARSFYRQLLGKQVDYKDVEWVDPEYYNSLCWILENDPTVLDLTFTMEADEFGQMKIIALKEGGEKIPVTNENKRDYVQACARYRLESSIKEQIDHLLNGFFEIIPRDLIQIFNEQEVELLISGTPEIDVDEWRSATDYNGYAPSEPVIVWWWRALKSFSREERAKMLSFVTGTSRVPLDGFTALQGVQGVQRFSIHKAYGDPDRLPQAHTCFNQIDLPEYSSYEKLRTQLLVAINEGGEGFGFA